MSDSTNVCSFKCVCFDPQRHGAMVFALSRTGIERSHIKSTEINSFLGEVIDRIRQFIFWKCRDLCLTKGKENEGVRGRNGCVIHQQTKKYIECM